MTFSCIQLYSLLGSALFMSIILYSVRQKKLKEAYSILWVFLGIILFLLSFWPNSLRAISGWIGIQYPPATLFLLLIAGLFLILFQFSLVLSHNQEQITRLAQEIAILKQQLDKAKEEK